MASTGISLTLVVMVIGSCLSYTQADGDEQPRPTCEVGKDGCGRCVDGNCLFCDTGYVLDIGTYSCLFKQTNGGPHSADKATAISCDPHCASGCTEEGRCVTKCDPGFVLGQDKTCKLCDSNCDPSSGCSQPGKCDRRCLSGYTLVNNMCQACALHCKSGCDVKGASKCDSECDLGFALTKDYQCFACDENCDITVAGCSKPFSCDEKCKAGFALSKDSNGMTTCQPCHVYCAGTCNEAGAFKCDEGQCKTGFTTCKTTKTCRKCSNGCDETVGCNKAGPNRCDKCLPGFYMDAVVHACYPCDPKCDPATGCDEAGSGKCDGKCKPGYQMGQNSKCYVIDEPDFIEL